MTDRRPPTRATLTCGRGMLAQSEDPRLCPACMRWHTDAPCRHNSAAPCAVDPAHTQGYRWTGEDRCAVEAGGSCWRCFTGRMAA